MALDRATLGGTGAGLNVTHTGVACFATRPDRALFACAGTLIQLPGDALSSLGSRL